MVDRAWRSEIQTASARIFLSDDGFVRVNINPEVVQTIVDSRENLTAAIEVCGSQKRPLLSDIRYALPAHPDARRYFSGKTLVDHFLALAILVDASPVGKMMCSVYFRVSKPEIPAQMFTDEPAALEWLTGFLK